jgi:hypothetical protein
VATTQAPAAWWQLAHAIADPAGVELVPLTGPQP